MQAAEVVGYVRVGPRESRRTRLGVPEQRRLVRAECEQRGWRLLRVEEEARSGRTLRRPVLQAALRACRRGEARGIVAARLDRLTYSLDDLALLVRDAAEHGYNIVARDLDVDLETPAGRHLASVLTAASHWRPRSISRRARQALEEHHSGALARGRPSSTPPELAERIRSLREGGSTLQAICDVLNGDDVPTPRGGSHWRPSSLRAILRPARP